MSWRAARFLFDQVGRTASGLLRCSPEAESHRLQSPAPRCGYTDTYVRIARERTNWSRAAIASTIAYHLAMKNGVAIVIIIVARILAKLVLHKVS